MLKLAAGVLFGVTLAAEPLAALKGKSRVLVVSASSAANPALVTQNRWLDAAGAGLRERDLVVIRIVGAADAQGVRTALGLPAARFTVALVGKDGAKALQQAEPITMTALFGAIDAMPMRQDEIRQRRP